MLGIVKLISLLISEPSGPYHMKPPTGFEMVWQVSIRVSPSSIVGMSGDIIGGVKADGEREREGGSYSNTAILGTCENNNSLLNRAIT